MAYNTSMQCTHKATTYLLLLVIAFTCANSARVLEEEGPPLAPIGPLESPNPVTTPVADGPTPSVAGPTGAAPATANGAAATSATLPNPEAHHPLTFFMQDALGGSNPSARVVIGVIANAGVNSQLPFSKNNANIFPVNGGIPLVNGNNGVINSNNIPFLTGHGGPSSASIVQTGGQNINGGNNLPFVTAGQLPAGATLQKLLFGTITVIDDEMTEGHELGSWVLGKAQGFYVASSQDGTSQTMALTAVFESEHSTNCLSFLGVHRTASPESQIAIISGTGRYANAKGYATVQTIHPVVDQHTTDGVDTVLQFSVYLSQ